MGVKETVTLLDDARYKHTIIKLLPATKYQGIKGLVQNKAKLFVAKTRSNAGHFIATFADGLIRGTATVL